MRRSLVMLVTRRRHSTPVPTSTRFFLAENDEMRVVLATWAPGKKDVSHSHPTAAVYTIKDCHARITTADGKVREVNNKAGAARINPPVASHTFENIGLNECQQVLVEKRR
jgi:hypothetical protein